MNNYKAEFGGGTSLLLFPAAENQLGYAAVHQQEVGTYRQSNEEFDVLRGILFPTQWGEVVITTR